MNLNFSCDAADRLIVIELFRTENVFYGFGHHIVCLSRFRLCIKILICLIVELSILVKFGFKLASSVNLIYFPNPRFLNLGIKSAFAFRSGIQADDASCVHS